MKNGARLRTEAMGRRRATSALGSQGVGRTYMKVTGEMLTSGRISSVADCSRLTHR
jgi:hypothetical protein